MTRRYESSGKVDAAVIKKLNDQFQLRLTSQLANGDAANQMNAVHLELDIEGEDYVSTIKYGTGLMSGSYMQSVGKGIALGFELMNLVDLAD